MLARFSGWVKGLRRGWPGVVCPSLPMAKPTSIYLVAGEVSGDTHGAALLSALRACRPDLQFHGRGGPRMKAVAGEAVEDWTDQAAVVGLWEVLKKYRYFKEQFDRTVGEIARLKPTAVVLIDYPGFNLRLATALRRHQIGPSLKIIYYISPQVWAWNRGRIPRMAKLLDLMICIFPFEPALYEPAGLKSVFVGHPLIDALAAEQADAPTTRVPNLVGLFSGSRQREVRKIFPVMLAAARTMQRTRPELRFATSAPSERIADALAGMWREAGWDDTECPVGIGDARRLMARADAGMVASGTATVEAASLGMPLVIVYRVAPLTYWVGRAVVRVPFLGMINLLAEREIAREFLQGDARPGDIAAEMLRLLDPAGEARAQQIAALDEVVTRLGGGGAAERAAAAVLTELEAKNP